MKENWAATAVILSPSRVVRLPRFHRGGSQAKSKIPVHRGTPVHESPLGSEVLHSSPAWPGLRSGWRFAQGV